MVPARTLTAIAGLLLVASACHRTTQEETNTVSDAEKSAQAAFEQEQVKWREGRAAELTQADGWTSLVGLHWITPGQHFVGSSPGSGIQLALGPPELGLLTLGDDDTVQFVPAKIAGLTLDGEPLEAPVTLQTDANEQTPSTIGFDEGQGIATVIKRGERHALRVKHAAAPTRTGFKGLDYWPASRDWVVEGRFEAHPPGRTMPIAAITGGTEDTPNPGVVTFERDGQTYRLEALDGGDGKLFLVFADRTNGHGSYPAGRFLYASPPDGEGRVMLDFNRGYNPPCAFTAFATCPLPPPENRMDLAIDAGEKTYLADH